MTVEILAAAAVLAAGFVHSTTGFGFALVATPVLVAAYEPEVAIPTVTVLSLLVNVLTLTAERRPRAVLRPATDLLIASSVPGMALGAVVLVQTPDDLLRTLVALSVLLAIVVHVRARARPKADGAGPAGAIAAGGLSGLLTTSTSLNGPPLVLYLLHVRATAEQSRDSLAAIFIATGLLGLATFAVAGTLELAPLVGILLAAGAVGQVIGRMAFARVGPHHESLSLGVLAVSAVVALVPVIQTAT